MVASNPPELRGARAFLGEAGAGTLSLEVGTGEFGLMRERQGWGGARLLTHLL